MSSGATYDTIGRGYTRHRRTDPRLAARVLAALGDARTIVNVGAGTGSYEPPDRGVVAVEPSTVMIAQRPPGSAPVIRARAEALPFPDATFDAALGILTVHHWTDRAAGLVECARVARHRVVLLTWDPAADGFWLVRDYLPEFHALDQRQFPTLDEIRGALGPDACVDSVAVPIPHDCADGFLGAFWARPAAYLDPAVRAGISAFGRVPRAAVRLERLRTDLASGAWHARYGRLLDQATLDIGYRLVVAHLPEPPSNRGHR